MASNRGLVRCKRGKSHGLQHGCASGVVIEGGRHG